MTTVSRDGVTFTYDQVFPDALGRLISNIVQLEFAIRVALHLQEPEEARMSTEVLRFAKPGDIFPENYLTNWDSLGKLITEYNRREQARGGRTIDKAIVDLRDALAHGRMSASTLTSEHRLMRFSQPDRSSRAVIVERVETLTLEWLEQQVGWTVQAQELVFQRIEELKPTVRRRSKRV